MRYILDKNYMSKELKKLYKTALVSINYFFLKIVFRDKEKDNCEKEQITCGINSHTYESVKRELSIFLETINKENLNEEVSALFKEELNSGKYLVGKSKAEIYYSLRSGIYEIFGYDYPELFEFYIGLI